MKESYFINKISSYQKKEITEHIIYKKLAEIQKNESNKKVLERISSDELSHYNVWKEFTKKEFKPSMFKIYLFLFICKVFGLTFGIKLLEKGEEESEKQYKTIIKHFPDAEKIMKEENEHEEELIRMIDEERLKYVGSIVLGLNDALVELTGSLAGLTLALQKSSLVALSGLIVGISASLSMSASEYLSTKAEEGERSPLKSSIYTGLAYVITVLLLVLPFFLITNPFVALLFSIFFAVLIIAFFNIYLTVAKDRPFFKPFVEMILISLSVAIVSFGIGYLARILLGADL
ncbi:MAG: VIT1/CCC1 transporter family protein [Acidobacteria bacterium]|nr:VIT1/CCC1 transporter family protein [Acidobacteriota bacterium]